jgi:hypothetical protein
MDGSASKLGRWGLFATILVLYLLFPTRKYYWDGISFAQIIEDARGLHPNLIHPNHLLYNVFGYFIYKVVGLSGIPVRSLYVLQVLNCVLSVLCAYVFFLILKSTFGSKYLSYTLTLLLSLSATWWRFSTDANAYIPAILFLLISFHLILPSRKPRPLLLGICHAISILFHQLAGLFGPVALLGIFYQASSQAKRPRWNFIFQYIAVTSFITLSAYYVCYYLRERNSSLTEFMQWSLSHSADSHFTFNLWNNLAATLRGNIRVFLDTSGRLPWTLSLNNLFLVLLFAGLIAAASILSLKLFKGFNDLKLFIRTAIGNLGKFDPLLALLIAWCSSYLIFLFFFLPGNTFYRLFYLPAIILLLGFFLSRFMASSSYIPRHRTALLVMIVAAFNFFFLIFPYSNIQGNPPLDLALKIKQSWPQGTVIYYTELNSDDLIIKYFNPQTTWRRAEKEIHLISDSDLCEVYVGSGSVWINTVTLDYLISRPEGKAWLDEHSKEHRGLELINKKQRIRYSQIFPPDRLSSGSKPCS